MSNNYYKIGSHNVICDICSRKRKREDVRKTWDQYIACIDRCWYPKHPNDMPRKIIPDGLPVADARPRPSIDNLPVVTWPGTGMTWEMANWDDPYWTWEDHLNVLVNSPLIIR